MNITREFTTRGRLGRGAFWIRHFTSIPVGLWLAIAVGRDPGAPWDVPFAAALLLLLVSTWGRRLHDRGRSAWWLLAILVPVLGGLFLFVECAVRGTSTRAARYASPAGTDYLTVRSPATSPTR